MAKQKRNTLTYQQQQIINADKDYDVLHPETESKVVLYNNTDSGMGAENVQDAIDELKAAIDGKSSSIETAPDYNEFFKPNKDPKNAGTAFSKDALTGDIKNNTSSDELTSAKQVTDYVDDKISGKIDYYGTVDSLAEVFVKMADATEGDMVRVTTEFAVGTDIAHVGDIIIAKSDKPTTIDGIKVAHTEIDTNTWTANSKISNGYVAKGEGHAKGSRWALDKDLNPVWMTRNDYDDEFEYGKIGHNYAMNTWDVYKMEFGDHPYKYIRVVYEDPDDESVSHNHTDIAVLIGHNTTVQPVTTLYYTDGHNLFIIYNDHPHATIHQPIPQFVYKDYVDGKFGTPAEGTYSVVRTNANGVVQAGGNLIEVGTDTTSESSANLVVGGIFFKVIEVSE